MLCACVHVCVCVCRSGYHVKVNSVLRDELQGGLTGEAMQGTGGR